MNCKDQDNVKLASELFKLISNLSKINSPDRIILIFVNALDNLFSDLNIGFDAGKEYREGKYSFEIATSHYYYGRIFLTGNVESIELSKIELLHETTSLLAIILERIERQNAIENEKALFSKLTLGKPEFVQSESILLQNLSENSPDVIFRFNQDLCCLYANKNTSLKLIGEAGKLENLYLKDMKLSMKVQNQIENEIKKVFKQKSVISKIIFSTINEKVFEFLFIPEFIHSQEIKSVFGFGREITEKYKIEKELIKAKERAEKSDQLKSNFLTSISHEIRTPLNGIIGFARLLMKNDISPEKRENYVKILETSTDNLLFTMSNILEMSKIESDEFHIYKKKIDIDTLMNDFYNEYKKKWKQGMKTGINFELALPENKNIIIYSDEYRIKEIFFNLVDNAFKFTREGFVRIGYQMIDNLVEFFVKDSGIGIRKNDVSKICTSFYQIDSSERKEYGGLGLGLTISKIIIEKLGGKMRIMSIYKKGTTIYFDLPLYKQKKTYETIKSKMDGIIEIEK